MQVTTVGLDLAKNIFQVHGITADGTVAFNKSLRRAQLLQFFENLEPCLIGMEACGSGHHWARQFQKLGHEVRLMPAMYVKAYVKRGKSDTIDAEAICEAIGLADRISVRVLCRPVCRQKIFAGHVTPADAASSYRYHDVERIIP